MASFGEALAALEDFRADLVNAQQSEVRAGGDDDEDEDGTFAFSGPMAGSDDPLANIHATGVGVREGTTDEFVVQVYMFDRLDAGGLPSLLARAYQGVGVQTDHLPIQSALAVQRAGGRKKRASPLATGPAAHQQRHRPVPAGVEIGPLGGNYVGTLGCFARRGPGDDGPLFALSNNHVLANVNRFALGREFTQPLSAKPADVICALSDYEPILFPSPTAQPRNVMDAGLAAVTDPAAVQLAHVFGIGPYNPQLLAPRPGMKVIKAGRTTGVTRGTIRAIRVRGVLVNFGTRQNPIIATFDNAIEITPRGGRRFSAPGDSGSVILDEETKRPVALLFAGGGGSTTACDMAAVCNRFNVRPV